MEYSKILKIVVLCSFIAACQTPEERATGEQGGSKDDSMKNSPPMTDPYAKPNSPDTTKTTGVDGFPSDTSKSKQ